jgi:RimJ/RimL family protein N-acetyltransferase
MLTSSRGLVLRPIASSDLDFVVSLRNDLAIERLASPQPPMPRVREEFESNLARPATRLACSDGTPAALEFLCQIDGTRAGIGGLYAIDYWARHAEIGVSLANGPWRGQGFGELAHRMLIDYGFDDLNLRRIVAAVHSDNARVLRLCEKLGFQIEGVRKEFRWVQGQYVDLHLLSMSRHDYGSAAASGADQDQ